jgi:hypothetical protein
MSAYRKVDGDNECMQIGRNVVQKEDTWLVS